jgi:hypothetical protein
MNRKTVGSLAATIPWLVHAGFAGLWGIAGYAAGFPLILVLAVVWTGALIGMRSLVAMSIQRPTRVTLNVLFLAIAFIAGWEGGISVLPGLACFLVADVIDPTTPAFPLRLPRQLVAAIAVLVAVVVVPIALTAPLFTTATSGAVAPGAPAGPTVVTTTTMLDVLGGPAVVGPIAAVLAVGAALLIRRRFSKSP